MTMLINYSDNYNSHIMTERAVLGVILQNPNQLSGCKIHIKSELMFCCPSGRQVWQAMTDLEMAGIQINLITVSDQLIKDRSQLDVSYLIELTESAPVGQNLEHFTKMVVTNYTDRRFRDILRARLAMDGTDIGGLMDALVSLQSETEIRNEFVDLGDIARKLVAKMKAGESLLEGHLPQDAFPQLNELAPICRGDLVVIGGQTSMGKTAFGIRLTTGLMNKGSLGIYLPFEGSFESLAIRTMGQECGAQLSDIRKNQVPAETMVEIERWADAMGGEVSFNNNVGNVSSIIQKIKLRKATGKKLDFVLIDHMHLMQLEKAGIREGFIDITNKLIQVAKDEDVLIIVLAQFRKLSEAEESERPRGSYIRESATICQDAHHVWLLHDPEFHKKKNIDIDPMDVDYDAPQSPVRSGMAPSPAEIVIEKNREGQVGVIPAKFNRSIGLWTEIKH